jgi:hypothetical protein
MKKEVQVFENAMAIAFILSLAITIWLFVIDF